MSNSKLKRERREGKLNSQWRWSLGIKNKTFPIRESPGCSVFSSQITYILSHSLNGILHSSGTKFGSVAQSTVKVML